MNGAALALAAALAAAQGTAPADLGARIGQSAAAAQRLAGPLDGAWILADDEGRPLFVLQITDPPQAVGPLAGAWRSAGSSQMGPITSMSRSGGVVRLMFAPPEVGEIQVRLTPSGDGWRGVLRREGRDCRVALRR